MFLYIIGEKMRFRKVAGGKMMWSVSDTKGLVEDLQCTRIMDALAGRVPKKGEKRVIEPFTYALFMSDDGRPVGEPLDLSKSPVELGIPRNAVLWLDDPPKPEPSASKARPPATPDVKAPPPPKPDAKNAPPKPTPDGVPAKAGADGAAAPQSAATGEEGDAKPKKKVVKRVVRKKPAGEGGDRPPGSPVPGGDAAQTTPLAAPAAGGKEKPKGAPAPTPAPATPAPPALPTPASPAAPTAAVPDAAATAAAAAAMQQAAAMQMGMLGGMGMVAPGFTGAPPANAPKTPGDEIPYMMQKLMDAEKEMEALQRTSYQEDDAYRRRMELAREAESVRRQRDESAAFLERERLRQREDELKTRERELQRQFREMQYREEQELTKRRHEADAARVSAAASPPPPPANAMDGWSPELILSVANLQQENRDLRARVAAIRKDVEARREQDAREREDAARPTFDLEGRVKDALTACGLERFARPFAVHGMDADAIICATTADLKELGLNGNEVRMLREALNPPVAGGGMSVGGAGLQLQPQLTPAAQLPYLPNTAVPSAVPPAGGGSPRASGYPLGNLALQVYAIDGVPASPKLALSSADAMFHRGVLTTFYTKYDRTKLAHIEFLLNELAGDIQGIYPALTDAYKLDVDAYYTSRVADFLHGTKRAAATVLAAIWKDREGELLSHLAQRPCDWSEMVDPHGRVYYFSSAFNVSQWGRPALFMENDARIAAGAAYGGHVVRSVADARGSNAAAQGAQRTPSRSPPSRLGARDQHYRAWVVAYLIKHAPHRVAEVDALLQQWSGPELVEMLTREYPAGAGAPAP